MENYNKLKTPPTTALKQIKAGRLKGMSDINPQWRIEKMTETYGECGIGWKYEVVEKTTIDGADGQIFAFVDINLYTKTGDNWSAPIPGTGGSMLIVMEKNGLHHNDEAFKMASTDALGVAMKTLGMAADVYMGLMNDSKYQSQTDYQSNNSSYKFGSAKDEALPWVGEKFLNNMIATIPKDKPKVILSLLNYRWSKVNKEKIIMELDKK